MNGIPKIVFSKTLQRADWSEPQWHAAIQATRPVADVHVAHG